MAIVSVKHDGSSRLIAVCNVLKSICATAYHLIIRYACIIKCFSGTISKKRIYKTYTRTYHGDIIVSTVVCNNNM